MKQHAHRSSCKRWFAALALLAACLGVTRFASASVALDAANRAFAEGRYGDAATRYEAILEHDGYSAPVLFDLGNAYLRQARPARALLAYERARLLAPRDPAIARNLEQARAAAGFEDPSSTPVRLARSLTRDEWAWLGAAAFWLAAAAAAGAFVLRHGRGWLRGAAAAGSVVATLSIAALAVASRVEHTALVLEATPLLVSPFKGAESSASLRGGAEVELERTHESFALVRDRAGHEGWLERGAVAPLVPDGAKFGT